MKTLSNLISKLTGIIVLSPEGLVDRQMDTYLLGIEHGRRKVTESMGNSVVDVQVKDGTVVLSPVEKAEIRKQILASAPQVLNFKEMTKRYIDSKTGRRAEVQNAIVNFWGKVEKRSVDTWHKLEKLARNKFNWRSSKSERLRQVNPR